MAVVTISQGSFSRGKEVAELVAAQLGYTCLARDVVLEASAEYNVPEVKLLDAVESPPSLFERWTGGKERYISYVRAALLRRFRQDAVVYHGLLGHYFVPGVAHVVKVRVLADPALRIETVMQRDGVAEREARDILERSDRNRRLWATRLYGVDPADPASYDLVVHVGKVTAEYAADMICRVAALPSFQATPSSQAAIEDLALAAEVEAALVEQIPGVEVTARDGEVVVTAPEARIRGGSSSEFQQTYQAELEHRVNVLLRDLGGIERLAVRLRTRG